jgi:hypothetical protein
MRHRAPSRCILIFLSLLSSILHSADIIPSDNTSPSTFIFNVGPTRFNESASIFFIGAADQVNDNQFSLSYATNSTNKFMPLTPRFINLNNEPNQQNPLNGAAIQQLALFDRRPVAVIEGNDTGFFMVNDLFNFSVLSASNFLDATGGQGHIVGITTDANGFFETNAPNGVFTALSPTSASFGSPGSGISFAALRNQIIDQGKRTEKNRVYFDILNANNPADGSNKPAALDITTDAVTIGAPLASINNTIVDMHWDESLGRLYLALQITTSVGMGNGGKAVASARVRNGLIIVESLVANTAVTSDSIIAAQVDAGTTISLNQVRTMHTSTRLPYLIVSGGIGTPAATDNKVFALPLVSTQNLSDTSGLLANKNAAPVDIFNPAPSLRFSARTMPSLAMEPGDLFTSTDTQAVVGGGNAPGPINMLSVAGDAIFISVSATTTDEQPGIFHSQAIFATNGTIKGWTSWRRVAGTAEGVTGFALDPASANFWYLQTIGGTTNTILRTKWQQEQTPLAQLLVSLFNTTKGGIQGLVDFPKETTGFNQTLGSRLSLLAASGYQQLVLIQTGADNNVNQFGPLSHFTPTFTSDNGSLAGFIPGVFSLNITGGAVHALGPIVSATMVSDGTQSWLVVGGSYGIAVLTRDDGTGAINGFSNGFSSLDGTMKFQIIGNYRNVIRLFSDGANLYVLTPNTLDRIAGSAANFAQSATPTITTLATSYVLPGAQNFLDALISPPFALLGTASGLWRVGDGADISMAPDIASVDWVTVSVPESAGAVSKIFPISPTPLSTDVAFGGMVYILNSSVSNHISRVYRYSLNLLPQQSINDTTMTLFNDTFIQGINTFFFNVGSYRNNIITDGATLFLTRSAYFIDPPFAQLLRRNIRFADPFPLRYTPLPFPVIASGFFSLFDVVRDSGSGSWIVPGDFGVYLNE